MATASKSRTQFISGNATSKESIYRDIRQPWITYIGTRKATNPNGPRNIWFVHNEKENQKTGPFITLKMAWSWVNGEQPPLGPITTNLPKQRELQAQQFNGTEPEPEKQIVELAELQMSLFEEKQETTDQIIEFQCPHCGKSVIGLLGRK